MSLHSYCPSTSSTSLSKIYDNKPFLIQKRSRNCIKPSIDKDIKHSIDQLSTHEIVTKNVTVHDHNPPFANSHQQPLLLETQNAPGNLSVGNHTSYPSHNENPPAPLKNKILNISENFKTREPIDQCIDDLVEGLENKERKVTNSTSKKQSNLASKINWEGYSSFSTLTRHVAWIIKLKTNWIKRKRGALIRESFSFLTATELASSRTLLLQVMQQESFPQEFKALSSGISVHNSSKIACLHPIFHNSLIKVGGKIRHVNISEESNQQIILSKYHHGTQLILRHIHENNLHVGRKHTLAISRQHYWIPSCRGLIRNMY